MKIFSGKQKYVWSALWLIAVCFKLVTLFTTSGVVWAQEDDWPKVYVYQRRNYEGKELLCSYGVDCIDDINNIFVDVQFEPKGSGECSFPGVKKPEKHNEIWLKELKINGRTFHKGFKLFLDENCQISSYSLSGFVGHLEAGAPSFTLIFERTKKVWEVFSGPKTYNISSALRVHTLNHCLDLGPCGDSKIPFFTETWKLCTQVAGDENAYKKCVECQNQASIWTAVGCISSEPTEMLQTLIKIGLTTGGGIALLIILAGSFTLSISQGDPKKTSEAKEMITSALIGLIFIIFSVSILQFIGVQILKIPGFGE